MLKLITNRFKKALPDPSSKDPVGHSMEPGDWVFWKHHQRKTALELSWKGPYQVLLTADTIAKLKGIEPDRKSTRLNSSHT